MKSEKKIMEQSKFLILLFMFITTPFSLIQCLKKVAEKPASSSAVVYITSADQVAQYKQTGKPFVLIFSSLGCPACKRAAPHIERLAQQHPDIPFLKFNKDNNPTSCSALMGEYGANAYPTFIFIDAQGKKIGEVRGFDQDQVEMYVLLLKTPSQPTKEVRQEPAVTQKPTMANAKARSMQKPHMMEPAPTPDRPMPKTTQPASAAKQPIKPVVKPSRPAGKLIELTSESQLQGLKTLVLIFSTSWCGPCKAMRPIYEDIAAQYSKVPFFYVDGDRFGGLKSKHGVSGYPTVVLIAGHKQSFKFSGQMGAELAHRYVRNFFAS